MPQIITVKELSNAEFFERHAGPGRVGLVGGSTLSDKIIGRAQKQLTDESSRSVWSHAFLCQGRRHDGHHWVIESDLQFHRRHIQLGVQENRVAKYHDLEAYPNVAIIDFKLNDAATLLVLNHGLEFVANHTQYSLRELVGAWLALRHPSLRAKTNLLAREKALFCSALVRQVFLRAGIDLLPGVDPKHTAPEDLCKTELDHTGWVMERDPASRGLRLRTRVHARVRQIKKTVRQLKRTAGSADATA
ncbi:MAG TPA: hypothetical protein VMF06_12640 [Candidatus Limnocylindria bacterium]|jgi:hypothetical protein|nr:hypothetical protein [Candidatus Limnocylindria bacterium]